MKKSTILVHHLYPPSCLIECYDDDPLHDLQLRVRFRVKVLVWVWVRERTKAVETGSQGRGGGDADRSIDLARGGAWG